jgi:hypothetical protein
MLKDPEAQAALSNLRNAGLDLSEHTKTTSTLHLLLLIFAFSEPEEESASELIWRIQRIVKWATRRPHDNEISHLLAIVREAANQSEYTIDVDALKMRRWRRLNRPTGPTQSREPNVD